MGLFKPNIEKLESKRDVERLVKLLGHKDSQSRERSAAALGRIGVSAVGPLIQALSDDDGNFSKLVIEALGSMGEPAAGPLIEALQNESNHPLIRGGAALALGEIGDHRALGSLLQALKDNHSVIRGKAADALDLMQWKPEEDSARFDYFIAKRKWKELSESGEAAVESLIESMKDDDPEIRKESASTLCQIGEAGGSVDALIPALKADDRDTRSRVVATLGNLGDRKAVEPLLEMFTDKAFIVRVETARALARIGEPVSIQIAVRNLILLFDVEDNNVASMIVLTLGGGLDAAVGSVLREAAVESLLQVLEDESSSDRMRCGAAMTLGNIGDVRAVEPLILALKDDDEEVGRGANGALIVFNKREEAEQRYRQAVRMNPGLAEAHYHIGNVLRHSGDAGEAMQEYREAIKLNPAHANAHKMLGGLLEQSGDLAAAEKEYAEALRIVPGNAKWHGEFGFFLIRLFKLAEAETELREAIRLNPDLAEAHANLGVLLGSIHQTTEARQELGTAIELFTAVGNSDKITMYRNLLAKI